MMLDLIALVICSVLLLNVIVNVIAIPRLRPSQRDSTRNDTSVAVLIPARNEEHALDRCLSTVVHQGPIVTEILIYDDCSDDRTTDIVQKWQARDARIRLFRGDVLPDGWYGKPYACFQLAQYADADWLLFLDADVQLAPSTVEGFIQMSERFDVSLLSAWPKIEMHTWIAQMLMPLLNFYVFTLYPWVFSILSNAPRYALAHGACILCKRSTYLRIGGHSLVKAELFEDTLLARAWRRHGERSLCIDGSACVSVRMYDTFSQLWQGFVKNFYPGFRSEVSFWIAIALHSLLALSMVGSILPTLSTWRLLAVSGSIVMMRILLALRFREQLWSILFHWLAEGILVAIVLASRWRWRSGRGVMWKNRIYTYSTVR